jgi:hypothetical protein
MLENFLSKEMIALFKEKTNHNKNSWLMIFKICQKLKFKKTAI